MSDVKKFVIKKDELTDAITYLEYESINGYSVSPKNNVKIEDMINVEKMVIINPTLITKLIDKKCKMTLEHIINLTSVIYENDDEDGDATGNLNFILNETAKFRDLVEYKYKKYMKEKSYEMLMKKIEIIENEVKLRKIALKMKPKNREEEKKHGKGR